MKRVRDVHQKFLAKCDQGLALMQIRQSFSMRRLPPEILGEIFMQCLPPETYIEAGTRTAPLLLMRVCRGWHKVALGTPRLWCSLSLRPARLERWDRLCFYYSWLSRARGCLLSLAVDTRQPLQNLVWQRKVTEFLKPYTSRTVHLHVTFNVDAAPNLLLKDVPKLERLSLKGDGNRGPKIAIVQPEPQLRSLILEGVVISAGVLSEFDLWTHLTQLRVTLSHCFKSRDSMAVLTLLARCPHLQDLAFSIVAIPPPYVAISAPRAITHSHLRSLEFRVLHGIDYFLDALTLPALRHLTIRDSSYIVPRTWRKYEFRRFVVRSQCPLETLEIHSSTEESYNLEVDKGEYVALIPTLKHVELLPSW